MSQTAHTKRLHPARDTSPTTPPAKQITSLMSISDQAPATEADESWFQQWKLRLKSLPAASYGVSLATHILLLLCCAFFVLTSVESEAPQISTRFSETRGEDLALDQIDVELLKPPTVEAASMMSMAEFIPAGMEPALKSAKLGDKTEVGDSVGFRMPTGGKVVTKGSFSAWTVPEDPKPREDYLIVIQLRLPEKITRYRKEDLTGFLMGDDGYETPIGAYRGSGFARKYYGRFDDKAHQFVIKIPGGAAKVKDVIRVESKVLKEKQVLVIDF